MRPKGDDDEDKVLVRSELAESRPEIEQRIKAYMARRLFGVEAYYPAIHEIDETFQAATTLWPAARDLSVASHARAT